MPYLIYAIDFDGIEEKREAIREAHRTHLRAAGKKLLASGALLNGDVDDGMDNLLLKVNSYHNYL